MRRSRDEAKGRFSRRCRDYPCFGTNTSRDSLPMFPSMEIFLMRVPSELAAGDGQLLLGGVAMPRLVAAPSASGRERWEVVEGVRDWAAAAAELALTAGSLAGGYPGLILARGCRCRLRRDCEVAARPAGKPRPRLPLNLSSPPGPSAGARLARGPCVRAQHEGSRGAGGAGPRARRRFSAQKAVAGRVP